MKKILLGLVLCAAFAVQGFAESYGSTNYTSSVKGPFLLMSGSGIVKNLTIVGGSAATTVALWDSPVVGGAANVTYDSNGGEANGNLARLWYTNAAYQSMASVVTNITTNYITITGVTNIYTNSYVYTYTVTNAATTNLCAKLGQWAVPANTVLSVSSPNILFVQNLYATTSTTNAASILVTTDTLR